MISYLRGTVTPKDWGMVGAIFILTLVLAGAFYFIVMQTMTSKIVALQTEYDDLSQSVKKAQETKANIENLREEAKLYQDLVSKFEERLPEEREIPQMLRQFEAIGNSINLQVKLSSMTPLPELNKETIPFKVTAFGDFHQIIEFVNELEREDRYFKITDIEISNLKDGASESNFILSTFRFLQQKPLEEGSGDE